MNAKVIEQYIEWAMSFEEWREPSLEKPHRMLLWATMCVYARATEHDLCSFKDRTVDEKYNIRSRSAQVLYHSAELAYGVGPLRFLAPLNNPYHNNISAWAIQKLNVPSVVEDGDKTVRKMTGKYALLYLSSNIRTEAHGKQIMDTYSYLFPEVMLAARSPDKRIRRLMNSGNPDHYPQAIEIAEIMYGEE